MRRELGALLVLLAVAVAGWLGWRALFGSGGARFEIVEVRGDVRHEDGLGGTAAAAPGLVVDARDRLVAGEGAEAVLAFGEQTRVTLEASSSLRVVGVDEEGVKLELEGGRVHATVRPGSGTVGVVAGDREIVAEDADFTAARDADGTLGVVAERGDVGVRGVPGATQVRAGERLLVPAEGSALLAPAAESLLLYVAGPSAPRTRDSSAEVRGRTAPGARVRVGRGAAWTEVRADGSGEWVARVDLAEGANEVEVEARDVLGNRARSTVSVVRDTRAPAVGVEIRY